MEFPRDFGQPHLLDLTTMLILVALTFLIQALIIFFHLKVVDSYRGIRMVLASTMMLAVGSILLLALPWLPRGVGGLGSGLLMFWGTALQYVALARFTRSRVFRPFLWVVVGIGSVLLVALEWIPGPIPFMAVRESLSIPLYFAVALVLRTAAVEGFRFGAVLTGIAFSGFGVLSLIRVLRGLWDPRLMQPGPNLSNEVDALFFFIFSFLWTSGFLLMLNQRLHSDLLAQATRDHLTDCLNRRAMTRQLADESARLIRYHRPFTVILLDLDKFKAINDTLGHGVGDGVLVGVAALLREALRTGDSLARWGGEEFLILLPETPEAEGRALAERLRIRVEKHDFSVPGFRVTFSAGVAGALTGEFVEDLCRRADQALYRAKETRNRVMTAE